MKYKIVSVILINMKVLEMCSFERKNNLTLFLIVISDKEKPNKIVLSCHGE